MEYIQDSEVIERLNDVRRYGMLVDRYDKLCDDGSYDETESVFMYDYVEMNKETLIATQYTVIICMKRGQYVSYYFNRR